MDSLMSAARPRGTEAKLEHREPGVSGDGRPEADAASPSDVVASRVVDRLVAEGLLGEAEREDCAVKLAAGTVRSADWRLWIENQLQRASDVGK